MTANSGHGNGNGDTEAPDGYVHLEDLRGFLKGAPLMLETYETVMVARIGAVDHHGGETEVLMKKGRIAQKRKGNLVLGPFQLVTKEEGFLTDPDPWMSLSDRWLAQDCGAGIFRIVLDGDGQRVLTLYLDQRTGDLIEA